MRLPLFALILCLAAGSPFGAHGQIAFTNATDKLPGRPFVGFLSKGIADVNGDGLDDIVRTHSRSKELSVLFQSPQGDFSSTLLSTLKIEPIATVVGDGDLDLYLAKCSMYAMGAANAADPRRINQLFVNHTYDRVNGQLVKNSANFSLDPTNWFSEAAASANVKISGQSWTADFADIATETSTINE